jgi:type II secretory pathway pseudopilin PulG
MNPLYKARGVGLIEVLVALFVLGFGLLSLAMFGNGLFAESGQVKARTEALQLAQQRIEQYRDAATSAGLDTIASETENNVSGVNATYTIVSTVGFQPSATSPTHATLTVAVSWSDKEGSHSVSLNSLVAAPEPSALGSLVADGLDGGGFVETPFGSARYGEGETYTLDPNSGASDLSNSYGVTGTNVYLDEPQYILTDKDDKVLLYSQTLFSTVTGRVYMTADLSATYESTVKVTPNDFAVCPKHLLITDNEDGTQDISTDIREIRLIDGVAEDFAQGESSSGTLIYRYFTYTCFFGTGWRGNIAALDSDGQALSDEVCLGSPTESDDGTMESRHVQLANLRYYRGYSPAYTLVTADDGTVSLSPSIDENGTRKYTSAGMVEADVYGDTSRVSVDAPYTHDFVVADLRGSVTVDDCVTEMSAAGTVLFANNQGSFVCLYDEDGNKNCPANQDLISNSSAPLEVSPSVVSGTILVTDGSTVSVDDLSMTTSQAVDCTITVEDATKLSWACNVYMPPGGWSGAVSLSSASLNICSADSFGLYDLTETYAVSEPFKLASSCDSATSSYNVSGVVRNTSQSKTRDLSGITVVTSTGISCSGSLGVLDTAKTADNEASFSCTVPANFNGSITLDSVPSHMRVVTPVDLSGSPVTGNVTGLVIEI